MIVMKFGGTSVGDAQRVHEAAAIALAQPQPRVVVVSAASGVTNLLIDAARAAGRVQDDKVTAAYDAIVAKHFAILNSLQNEQERNATRKIIEHLHVELLTTLGHIAADGQLTDRLSDRVVSFGEKCSSVMMAATMRDLGHRACHVFAESLIGTDNRHGAARPDRQRTREMTTTVLLPLLDDGQTVVVTGFIGSSPAGETTTLGRGGSDYSATLLGAALDADEVQIWTDVPGVLTSDPRKVPTARVVPEVSFDEAQELAHFGAKVLHPRTIRPAVTRNIPVRILSTFAPEEHGTVVTRETSGDRVKAVTALKGLIVLSVEVPELEDLAEACAAVFQTMATDHIEIVTVSQASSRRRMTFLVDGLMGGCARLQERLEGELSELDATVQCTENVAILAAVGAGAARTPTALSQMLRVLHRANVPVLATNQQTSNVAMLVVIPEAAADRAVEAVHNAFIRPMTASSRSRRGRRSAMMAETVRVG
jgi:aspartate kinase